MKIQFVLKENGEIVQRGAIYDVDSIECGWYRIIDMYGEDQLIPPYHVEVIEQYPIPPETQPVDPSEDKGWLAYIEKYGEPPL